MRIDYAKYPIINFIGKGFTNEEEVGSNGYLRGEALKEILTEKDLKVYVLSKQFYLKIQSIEDKLNYILTDQLPKDGIECQSGVLIIGNCTILYRIVEYGLYSCIFRGLKQEGFVFDPLIKSDKEYLQILNSISDPTLQGINKAVMHFLLFKKYAEVEEKIITKHSGGDAFNCRYINNTNKNIRIMDSTWWTTITQSEGFNVSGHFRLQPVGEGRKERKLIWINDFQKNGYTRLAGKIKEDEQV